MNAGFESGQFCDLMSKTNKDPKEMEQLILQAFHTFDADNSGYIDKEELMNTLTQMG